MSAAYTQLLDATIAHLEKLREDGVQFVPVKGETLRALNAPLARPSASLNRATTPERPAPPTPAAPVARDWDSSPSPPAAPAAPRSVSPAAASRWSQAAALPKPVAPVPRKPAPPPAPEVPLPPKLEPAAKEAALAALRVRVLSCVKCPNLVTSRKSVVFGVGDIHARLMFIGEAPGADEDERGEPFVGKAGELLTKIILATGLIRSQVFIANILKCRPDTPGQSAGNRKPTTDEMATCIPWLHEQINLIQPEAMVALGATAVEGLLGKTEGITRLRGNWRTYRGIPLMPTYHPAYLLRNQALSEKRKVWEDMLAVMEKLQMPISEKQHGFFLVKG
jgi:DNA polymerase